MLFLLYLSSRSGTQAKRSSSYLATPLSVQRERRMEEAHHGSQDFCSDIHGVCHLCLDSTAQIVTWLRLMSVCYVTACGDV